MPPPGRLASVRIASCDVRHAPRAANDPWPSPTRTEAAPTEERFACLEEGIEALRRERPSAALELLTRFPGCASAHYLFAQVSADCGDRAGMVEHYLAVHRLDACLDDALEPEDAAALEEVMLPVVVKALTDEGRRGLDALPITWRSRPAIEQVKGGFDPRALAALEVTTDAAPTGEPQRARYRLVLYRTNLLASTVDEAELRGAVRAAVRAAVESAPREAGSAP